MPFLFAFLGPLVKGVVTLVPGLATIIGNVIVAKGNTEAARQADQNKSGTELALGWMQSANALEETKARHQTERQIMFALLGFALPTAVHWWFVLMDSVPFYFPYIMHVPHKVASWGVAAPPGRWADMYFKIIDSFFISGPALVGVKMLADAFKR